MLEWPVLKRYEGAHTAKIALPLGGIGTGTVSLGGRGDLRDWEIVNRPAKGFTPDKSFFALRTALADSSEPVVRALEGPLDDTAFEGGSGSGVRNHGLPRFRHGSFEAAYPLGQVILSDPAVPLTVRIQAFNPLIPGDPDRSGLPVAVIRFILTNTTDKPVHATVCGNVQNFIGSNGAYGKPAKNVNEFRQGDGVSGLFMRSEGVPRSAEQWGTISLTALTANPVTYRTAWADLSWGDSLLDFWDDLSEDGRLDERKGSADDPMASLAVEVDISAGGEAAVTFLLSWHFPNRLSWYPQSETRADDPKDDPDWVGNHYATRFSDSWHVAQAVAADLPALEADTVAFVQAVCDSDLPEAVLEAALFNLSTLRTQTCFRTADGHFFGWEGCADHSGSCHGSCTHVWNYEQATAFLFASLARSMREIEFLYSTDSDGRMSFRTNLPLGSTPEGFAAADGQMGCLMKLYRDWRLCGDGDWLRKIWPAAKRALEFCWIRGGWDADRDGVMEGCQHNTMDVEYFGPNPQMQGWYLGALRAMEEMARYLGEEDFAVECRRLFEQGREWTDANLFNGDYYEHEIRPISDPEAIAKGLRLYSGASNLADPDLQLGAGCLVDQLVGQYMAKVCGLGDLLDPSHVTSTLESLMRWNFRPNLWDHFNHLRSFALADESAMLMATYPKGRRPTRPFPYYNEVMTGFEYTAAIGMLQEGMETDGLRLIEAIRARYDGRRRSPFNEAECGHHYARAMASWAAVLALTGFQYDAVTHSLSFALKTDGEFQTVFSTGEAWGTVRRRLDGTIGLQIQAGSLTLQSLTFGDAHWEWTNGITLAGNTLELRP